MLKIQAILRDDWTFTPGRKILVCKIEFGKPDSGNTVAKFGVANNRIIFLPKQNAILRYPACISIS